ncbi:phosphoinositide 3-kinase adapter protein 1 [Caerostris extrusa]|uniref:Phosphoinositide 3-kinase adapter protein 1 n=1 Tax=Caerostris extrusa TaxID=172846 RepID=A0AAV4SZW4_CAEEX|nr:phosphoinositide 3-kinase adapter protein 1 [Caerostris extrusa]
MRDTSGDRKKHSKQSEMAPPDVTFIFAEDVTEWDSYLSHQFEGTGTVIHHEQVEKMVFPLACSRAHVFSNARVVLVILSPALVAFLDKKAADCFQFTKLLKPGKTIAMVCGASQANIASVKNVLVSYDDWRHLEAKDKDINMVRNVIEMIHETLAQSKESEKITKPKFKLVPRKVHEGNGKVYVILAKPLDPNARIRITLEAKGAKEVPVKKRNPFTLVFVIPDDFIHVQNMVNVHIWCGEDLMGVSSVKCASKLGELYSLLSTVPSPYEFLCSTMGVGSLHEVDFQLAAIFRKNLPKSGFNLLGQNEKLDKLASKEEFPTLLHFAARYGLANLAKELLDCPGALTAITLKNSQGLFPAQMANHEGHNKVASLLDDFSRTCANEKDLEKPLPCIQNPVPDSDLKKSNPTDYYDIPAQPVPVLHLPTNQSFGNIMNDQEPNYLKMKGSQKKENIEPCQSVFLDEHLDSMKSVNSIGLYKLKKAKLSLLESQAKLIEIMEAYKKGASLTEVEKMHNEWKQFYEVSDSEAKNTLNGLRNLYAKAQKAKLNKKHSSSFSELRQFLNFKLRRKESIDSKNNTSRRNSKDSNCSDKFGSESSDPTCRPVSTLSVHSNTSSSSGSSFDRLSTVSAGSDSGHHSDFGDDRSNKFKERFESRYHQKALNGISNLQRNMPAVTLNSKPPAPPPRPIKSPLHYGSLEDCKQSDMPQYATSRKSKMPSYEETLRLMDYSIPSSRSSTLNSDFRFERNGSVSSSDFCSFDADYDRPPPPRPSNSSSKSNPKDFCLSPTAFMFNDPRTDYDMVPPPLPLSAPPLKQDSTSCEDQSYDILPSIPQPVQRSDSVFTDYDFPKTLLMDNTDNLPACTCRVTSNKNSLIGEKQNNIANEVRHIHNQYSNILLNLPNNGGCEDDIPNEMAPPPPIIEEESPEEHYKMVGTPVPVPSVYKVT